MPLNCVGYAVQKAGDPLMKWSYSVRDLRPNDIEIQVLYSGICHTDLHLMNDDWGMSRYPMVPGHEIVGRVVAKGSAVAEDEFQVGDAAGIGCFVWSCRKCTYCRKDAEQYCPEGVLTYAGAMPDGEITYGGYGNRVVAPHEFCVKLPAETNLSLAAPLFCAGITCWSPMKHFKMDAPGKKIGVIGLGGLGHMAVKLAVAFGNPVTVISTSSSKKQLAAELGATDFVNMAELTASPAILKQHQDSLDFIIDTVSAEKPMDLYLSLLAVDGVLVTVGLPENQVSLKIQPSGLIMKRKTIAGSLVGSVKEIKDMMKFCAQREVYPMIEVVPVSKVNEAVERLRKNDVRFRFVMDMSDLQKETASV